MPSSRTSRAARGGWSYPYLPFNSSVVMWPCLRIWSITVFGRLPVTEAHSSRNSFGYFGFAIRNRFFHQLHLLILPVAVHRGMNFQFLRQRRREIQRFHRHLVPAQQGGLRGTPRLDF